jgi:hypothetical protein
MYTRIKHFYGEFIDIALKGLRQNHPMSHGLVLMVICMHAVFTYFYCTASIEGRSGGLVANFFLHLPPSLARTIIGLGHETEFKFLIKMNSSRSK